MQLKLENNNKKELQLEVERNEVEKENLKAKELWKSVKSTVVKVSK